MPVGRQVVMSGGAGLCLLLRRCGTPTTSGGDEIGKHAVDLPREQGYDLVETNVPGGGPCRHPRPRRSRGSRVRMPTSPSAHYGVRWPAMSVPLDRSGGAVDGTQVMQPAEGLGLEMA